MKTQELEEYETEIRDWSELVALQQTAVYWRGQVKENPHNEYTVLSLENIEKRIAGIKAKYFKVVE